MTNTSCPDCNRKTCEFHEIFCLKERCPFCYNQLVSCGCIHKILELSLEESDIVNEYIDDYDEPLASIIEKWKNALNLKGRICV